MKSDKKKTRSRKRSDAAARNAQGGAGGQKARGYMLRVRLSAEERRDLFALAASEALPVSIMLRRLVKDAVAARVHEERDQRASLVGGSR